MNATKIKLSDHTPEKRKAIERALFETGMSRNELARRVGCHRNTVRGAIQFGQNRETLKKIEETLGLN